MFETIPRKIENVITIFQISLDVSGFFVGFDENLRGLNPVEDVEIHFRVSKIVKFPKFYGVICMVRM